MGYLSKAPRRYPFVRVAKPLQHGHGACEAGIHERFGNVLRIPMRVGESQNARVVPSHLQNPVEVLAVRTREHDGLPAHAQTSQRHLERTDPGYHPQSGLREAMSQGGQDPVAGGIAARQHHDPPIQPGADVRFQAVDVGAHNDLFSSRGSETR